MRLSPHHACTIIRKKRKGYFCLCVYMPHLYVHSGYSGASRDQKNGYCIPGTRITVSYESPCGVLETKLSCSVKDAIAFNKPSISPSPIELILTVCSRLHSMMSQKSQKKEHEAAGHLASIARNLRGTSSGVQLTLFLFSLGP